MSINWKVLNIFEDGRLGGPHIYVLNYAKEILDQCDVKCIVPIEESNQFCQRCDEMGLNYSKIFLTRISKSWRLALRYIFFWPIEIILLTFLIKYEGHSIVYVCGGAWQYKGVIAGKLARKKVLWHLNDSYLPNILLKVFGILSPLADGYVYASERTKAYYKPYIQQGKLEFVIPASVDTVSFNPSQHFESDENLLEHWQNKIVIGVVANINPIKGLETLIHAASILNHQFDNLVFTVVGKVFTSQKRYFEQLQNICRYQSVNNIYFVGGRSEIRPFLNRFNIYVCCSLSESSPIAVWEAMSMGKAIVSTDVGDVPLYVRHNHNGFIVEVGDFKKMSDYISVLIQDELLRSKIGGTSRNIAVNQLDSRLCAIRHLEAFTDIQNQVDIS